MIEMITPRAKFICDRCGTSELLTEDSAYKIHEVKFIDDCMFKTYKQGQICKDCYSDFIEIADLFFDDVNKEGDKK